MNLTDTAMEDRKAEGALSMEAPPRDQSTDNIITTTLSLAEKDLTSKMPTKKTTTSKAPTRKKPTKKKPTRRRPISAMRLVVALEQQKARHIMIRSEIP